MQIYNIFLNCLSFCLKNFRTKKSLPNTNALNRDSLVCSFLKNMWLCNF